jgi:hypothetical protein
MQTATITTEPSVDSTSSTSSARTRNPYEACIEASRRIRWEIDRDVFRGRDVDVGNHFLPEGLSLLGELPFLDAGDHRSLSQIQGRTYANVFGLVERFINAKVLELSRDHWFGDQKALEALVRFSDEELKHQELFRRLEAMIAKAMPAGYRFTMDPDGVANAVLGASTWAVLALTCHIELFTQAHYRQSIEPDPRLSPLFKDVFLFHWKEESQHAILDELEWRREHAKLTPMARDKAVDDFIGLVGAVDGLLQGQAVADVDFLLAIAAGQYSAVQVERLRAGVLRAYRWQYILSGARHPHFVEVLGELVTPDQHQRIGRALAGLQG